MNSLDKFRTPNTNLSMGIEIECFQRSWNNETRNFVIYPNHGQHYGFFYATDDGSIDTPARSWNRESDEYIGTEFVSQPLSPKWLKKEIHKLSKLWPWMHNNSCGIHIHVSRKWLSEKKARTIYAFLKSLGESDRKRLFGRESNTYCGYSKWGDTRYNAINADNSSTFEFRVFSSGDAKWACYCVDMVEYLIRQAYVLNIDAIHAFRDTYKDLE